MYTYELAVLDMDCSVGLVAVRLTNRCDFGWEKVEGPGELLLGLRLVRPGASVAAVEARKSLPAHFGPGQTGDFELRFDVVMLGTGCFWLDVGLLLEGVAWLPQDCGSPVRMQVVVTAPPRPSATPRRQVFGSDLDHPYRGRPSWTFWSSGVANQSGPALDPVASVPFTIGRTQQVATAGSCFAQNIALQLQQGGNFLCTEPDPGGAPAAFSARYGNIYTAHQLRQLLHRAYGLLRPSDIAWERADGRFIDPFRPQLFPLGFSDEAAVCNERERHLAAVRTLFEHCDVFVFTLGLTETWSNLADGVSLPIPPGAVAARAGNGPYAFRNYGCDEIVEELRCFIGDVRLVNPGLRVILTVSPVPLVATYEDRHVLVANTLSKSVLRIAAEQVSTTERDVAYFPSYELVTTHASGDYFGSDARSVTTDGVAHVMRIFQKHYMAKTSSSPVLAPPAAPPSGPESNWFPGRAEVAGLICDEQLLDA